MTRDIKIEPTPVVVRTGHQISTVTVRTPAGGVVSVPVVAVPMDGTVTVQLEVGR